MIKVILSMMDPSENNVVLITVNHVSNYEKYCVTNLTLFSYYSITVANHFLRMQLFQFFVTFAKNEMS